LEFHKGQGEISDSDIGGYWRPEVGNNILSGSEDPECDPKEWVENPDDFSSKASKTRYQPEILFPSQRNKQRK
jgi:sarcosine oxidase subunit beta